MHKLIKELKERGLINNITNEQKLEQALANDKAIYIGFDPSAISLHLGNYVAINVLQYFKAYGIKTYVILGGATGMIGDPGGRSSERNLLDEATLLKNVEGISKQLTALTQSTIINNYDFYKDMNFMHFLRVAGKLINVNYLLEKEVIASRLESGISFTEFSYNLIQGYDFLQLYNNYDVSIQVGGSDQWGNITTGIEMIRKSNGDDNTACGITINLLTNSEGKKFGKSEKGAVFLDEELTSVYEMYQFLLNQPDADVKKLLLFTTRLPLDEIEQIMLEHETNKGLRYAQKRLAETVVVNIHGQEKYNQAVLISQALFSGKLDELNHDDFILALKNLETTPIEGDSISLLELLIAANISTSNRISRELISNGSIMINNQKIVDNEFVVKKIDAYEQQYTLIKKGKRNYYLVLWK
ncbi:tyrosine--tRNA ligase [Ureaplasma diversum]|uniref:Tyrosine--tRNA ligase n=1 Tax=Ureaplasma diversum NCTC 246 TaxID=1188241 RepID=A0A084F1E0_9BACT|nr:tyrosine--tRNA ligase [Ureaplasma diversum]KEZ24032.1 Tyrosyl-tRNA synthetase [Ureaplasma diversum NCTC 246]